MVKNIVVLKGGPSAERDVSLKTGPAAAKGLRDAGYQVTEMIIEDDSFVLPKDTDMVFIALHGTFGEDGTLQKILELRKMPFTGANSLASKTAFHKESAKEQFRRSNVPTAESQLVQRLEDVTLPLPLFIKPNAQGSSVGTAIAITNESLAKGIGNALQFDDTILVERFIKGREFTVCVLGEDVLPIVEVIPSDGYFDYANKYSAGRTETHCPARLPDDVAREMQRLALAAHRAVGDTVYSRVDFLLEDDARPFCLEVNTIPGMTATSILPKAAAAAGISFPDFCRRVVELSWDVRVREGVCSA